MKYKEKSTLSNEDILMGKYFGTDGFRGEAGITLTADHTPLLLSTAIGK